MKTLALAAALMMAVSPVLMGCADATATKTAKADDASAKKPSAMICVQHHDIDGWGMRHDGKMVVSTRFGKKYLLSLSGWCNDFDFSFGAAFQSPGHIPGMCLDTGDYVVPVGNDMTPPGARCYITKIERYTPEMQAEYKKARAAAKAEAKKSKSEAQQAAAKTDPAEN